MYLDASLERKKNLTKSLKHGAGLKFNRILRANKVVVIGRWSYLSWGWESVLTRDFIVEIINIMKMLLLSDDFTELKFFKSLFAKFSLDYEISNNPKLIGGLLLSFNPDVIIVSSRSKKFEALRTINELLGKAKGAKFVLLKNVKTEIDDRYSIADVVLDSPPTAASFLECLVTLGGDRDKLLNRIKADSSGKATDSDKTVVSGGSDYGASNDKVVVKGGDSNNDVHVVGGGSASEESQMVNGRSTVPKDEHSVVTSSAPQTKDSLSIAGEDQEYVMQIINQSVTEEKLIDVDEPERGARYNKIISELDPIDTKTHLASSAIAVAQKKLREERKGENFEELNKQKRKFVEVMFTPDDED